MTQGQSEPPEFDPERPFALQLEWLANRYNPGHFLGGTIRPELRVASLGWHGKRIAGAWVLIEGSAALPWSLPFGLLCVVAGIRMWKVATKPVPSRHIANPAEGRELRRAIALAGLGVGVVAVGSMLALAGVGMAMAVSRGNAVIGAAIFGVLAGFAATRLWRRPTRSIWTPPVK